MICAELDMTLPAACKMEHDAIGHYARPDVLRLIVNEEQKPPPDRGYGRRPKLRRRAVQP